MTTTSRRATATSALLASLTSLALLVPGAAHAERADLAEPPGDTAPELDIRYVTIDNRPTRLNVAVDLGRFDRQRTSVYAFVGGTGARRDDLFVVGWSSVRGERPGRLLGRLTEDGVERRTCEGLRIDVGRRGLDVSVPQRCLGPTAGTVKVGVLTERRTGRDADEVGPTRVRRG
ncbi:hypothetical protein [Nocardioides nanhaiensis]|uniref:Uncharacterized protein n=1 Tax=Nocardioides nanhaiensis TaxID=1476871 RepID=A0ABP8VRA0_9ACTN